MKSFLKLWIFLAFSTALFAESPFSLESLSSVNITVLNKHKHLNDAYVKDLEKEIASKLSAAGIGISTKHFSNFLIKIQETKVQNSSLMHVTLSLVENAHLKRSTEIDTIAITYSRDDFFETKSAEVDVKESILFLVDEFIDQYKEENPKPKK